MQHLNVKLSEERAHSHRVVELDGLRGIAILLVIVCHYFSTQVSSPPGTVLSLFIGLGRANWSGVDLFFILSGFLIGGILLDNGSKVGMLKTFYIRRACRILPLYLATLPFQLLTVGPPGQDWWHNGVVSLANYLTFTQNFAFAWVNDMSWLDVTWSLAVEEQFYLLLPLLLVVLPFRIGVAIIVAMIAAAPVLRYLVGGVGAYVLPFCRADAMLMGVMCAIFVRQPIWANRQMMFRSWLPPLFGVMFAGFFVLLYARVFLLGGVFGHLYLAFFFAVVLLMSLAHSGGPITRGLRHPALQWFGLRSYGAYLFHQPIAYILHGALTGAPPAMTGPGTVMITLSAFVLTCLLVELSYKYFERPFLEFGRSFTYGARRRTEAAVSTV